MTLITIIANSIFILLASLIIIRIAGLRTFAKMSSIDFATTIAIGSVIASTILSSNTSVLQGILALISIITVQLGTARLIKNYDWISKIVTNKPLLLMKNGKIIKKNLDRSGVSHEDLMAKLREANALNFENIKAVVFETTGDVSVLHGSSDTQLDKRLLDGVQDS